MLVVEQLEHGQVLLDLVDERISAGRRGHPGRVLASPRGSVKVLGDDRQKPRA